MALLPEPALIGFLPERASVMTDGSGCGYFSLRVTTNFRSGAAIKNAISPKVHSVIGSAQGGLNLTDDVLFFIWMFFLVFSGDRVSRCVG